MFQRIVIADGSCSGDSLQTAVAKLQMPSADIHSFHVDSSRPGDTLDGLLEHAAANKADLLVLGARSHSMARRVAMLAPCSVLMVPDGADFSPDRLLVPVDFSDTAAEALREAVRIASRSDGAVTVVAVETENDPWLDWHNYPEHSRSTLDDFVAATLGSSEGIECLVEPEIGFDSDSPAARASIQNIQNMEGARTAASIVGVADRLRTSLIVAGTRGRTQASSIFIGSVAEKIIHFSPVPVLAVKQPSHRLGLLQGLVQSLRRKRELVAS